MNQDSRRRWVEIFSALASEPRLQIVEMLAQKEVSCREVLAELSLSQPTISYHLGKLEQAGVLVKEKTGTRNCYRLDDHLTRLVTILPKGEN